MLKITIPEGEIFDEKTGSFEIIPGATLSLEHSLVSISKWEANWHKPFLTKDPKTQDEILDYIKCMTITQCVNPLVYYNLGEDNIKKIVAYIEDPSTATTINRVNQSPSREIVTSELIYYWMISLNIPVEFQKWHLNRLMTLIEVCSIKNKPPKKMGKQSTMAQNKSLNASRRAKLHTRG